MVLQWLQANGATSNNANDAWKEMLVAQTGLPEENYQRNDYWYELLILLGADPEAIPDMDNYFWCELGGIIGTDGPQIITQPLQQCYTDLVDHTWTVEATSGDGSPLTYQWQERLAGVWTDMPGETTDTLTITPTFPDDEGRQFRCVVCNDFSCRNSQSVTMCFTGVQINIITEDGLDNVITEDGLDEMVTEDSE